MQQPQRHWRLRAQLLCCGFQALLASEERYSWPKGPPQLCSQLLCIIPSSSCPGQEHIPRQGHCNFSHILSVTSGWESSCSTIQYCGLTFVSPFLFHSIKRKIKPYHTHSEQDQSACSPSQGVPQRNYHEQDGGEVHQVSWEAVFPGQFIFIILRWNGRVETIRRHKEQISILSYFT